MAVTRGSGLVCEGELFDAFRVSVLQNKISSEDVIHNKAYIINTTDLLRW